MDKTICSIKECTDEVRWGFTKEGKRGFPVQACGKHVDFLSDLLGQEWHLVRIIPSFGGDN